MNNIECGQYVANKYLRLRFELSSVGISKGTIVSVSQVDKGYMKVLIGIGRDVGWFHFSILESFTKV